VTPPASHFDLLAAARAVRQAAVADDTAVLHTELLRLRTDLVNHLDAEQEQVDRLPGAAPIVVRDGQQRLLGISTTY
jgi:hypothetical protein